MSSTSGDLRTCDVCDFTEFVPGWTITEAEKKRWAHVRSWNRLTVNQDRLDVCSQACLIAWAARGDGADG